ncbi:energy transducer TonB [Sphingobacterium sp. SYP-B4668]|uniref:energy transducer TonB n=1 Tax=Sphingobacterium sp. SYP-B4668 TaxID=2996035 RepID=UPI0022DE71C2|nr:energy transducer TonB [Sphingobacterium sp. SYP-B4668]
MIYLILVNISLLIGYALYSFFFKKLTFFHWNRYYLLGAIITSLLVPIGLFIDLSSHELLQEVLPTVDLSKMMDVNVVVLEEARQKWYLIDFLSPLYWCGVLISILWLGYRVFQLQRMISSKGNNLSFSFFNKIFVGKHMEHNATILMHEQVHVKQGHTYDIVLIELVKLFNWFNPILSLYSKELKFQHECLADEACSEDRVAYAELLVAHAMNVGPSRLTHEFSNDSFLKKRIMMLFRTKSKRKHKYLYLSIVPVLLMVTGSTMVFNTSKAKNMVAKLESKVAGVVLPITSGDMHTDYTSVQSVVSIGTLDYSPYDTGLGKGVRISTSDSIGNELFTAVERNPEPVEGMSVFRQWIGQNYRIPDEALDAGVNGTLQVSFIVEKDGALTHFNIKEDLGYGTGEAAIALMKRSKNWRPGVQNGRAVRVAYVLPIQLNVTQSEASSKASPVIGEGELIDWLSNNFRMPRQLNNEDVDPYIGVKLTVNEQGVPTDITAETDLGEAFKRETIRLISQTQWHPAKNGTKAVLSKNFIALKFDSHGKFKHNYTRVDVHASPIGGMAQFQKSILSSFVYDDELIRNQKNGEVSIQFSINENGEPSAYKIVKEMRNGQGVQLWSLIAKQGAWAPAILDGKNMGSQYEMTIGLKTVEGVGVLEVKKFRGNTLKKS